jgi:hypothetical protein
VVQTDHQGAKVEKHEAVVPSAVHGQVVSHIHDHTFNQEDCHEELSPAPGNGEDYQQICCSSKDEGSHKLEFYIKAFVISQFEPQKRLAVVHFKILAM